MFAEVPTRWRESTLGEVCARSGGSIQTGPFGSQLHASDYVQYGIPSIMPENLSENRVSTEGIARISAEDAERLSRYRVRPGDILYSRRGDVTKRALARKEHEGWLCGTGCLRVRFADAQVRPLYAFYYLGHPLVKGWIKRHAIGATLPNLNTSILSALPFLVPPLREQIAIAELLGTLDDKIELNRRMNETLEAMARAIFKSWFVDFDPVRAKAEGRQPFGMAAATAALFPDSFQDSSLGKIPNGWKVASLGEEIDSVRGLSYSGQGLAETGFPLHNLNSILEGGGYKYEGVKHYIGEYEERHKVKPGDLIVTNTEQGFDFLLIGYPAIVPGFFGDAGLFSHHLYRVRPKPPSSIKVHFLYWLLMSPLVRPQIIGCTNGPTVNMLAPDGLQRPQFALPPPELVNCFETLAAPLHSRTEGNHEESVTLAATCDSLLPKLISGELRVRNAA